MHFLTILSSIASVAVAAAQSPLLVAPAGGAFFSWTVPTPDPQVFFDLSVTTTVTLQALTVPLFGPVGQQGRVELWITVAGVTTFVGHETDATRWYRASFGSVLANGTSGPVAQLLCESCQDVGGAPLVLAPGDYGCAVRYLGVAPQLCAVPSVSNAFASAELTVSGGAIQYNAFATPPASVGGGYAGWSWYGSLHYADGNVPHGCASTVGHGGGCQSRHASLYQRLPTAAAAATVLDGKSLTFLPNGLGAYTVLPGLIASYPYVAPGTTAIQVPLTDDGESMCALTLPFPYPGGSAASLFVHANGYVSMASNNVLTGFNWYPQVPSFLAAPATGFWVWHDLNPAESGGGVVWFEEDLGGSTTRITWLGVESSPTSYANPSTFQMVFDSGTGIVTLHFVTIDPIGGATNPPGDAWVVGYSPGGPSQDPGPTDLGLLMAGNVSPVGLVPVDTAPLTLAVSAPPRLGTTISLHTVHATGVSFGGLFVGSGDLDPGLDLTPLGAPGCQWHVDLATAVAVPLANGGLPGVGMAVPLVVPNSPTMVGARLFGQSAWFDVTANPFGFVTSNCLQLDVGNW